MCCAINFVIMHSQRDLMNSNYYLVGNYHSFQYGKWIKLKYFRSEKLAFYFKLVTQMKLM